MSQQRVDRSTRWTRIVGGTVVISILVSLGVVVYTRASDRKAGGAIPSPPTPSVRLAIPIPPACEDLQEGELPPAAATRDVVFTNGIVITMDTDGTRSGTVAIEGGEIVSTDPSSVSDAQGQSIDLEGATVLPGFVDSHSHWIGDKDQVGQSAPQAIRSAISNGWTSISELFVSEERLDELCQLEKDGELRVKVGAFLPLNYQMQRFGHWYDSYTPGEDFGPHLFVQGLKFFADGAIDGLGYQTRPPDPSVQGVLFWELDELAAEFQRANEAGWQIAIHATGDGGLDLALDAFETIAQDDIVRTRHRVEHLTIVRDDQIDRIKDLGLIGSIQLSWFHGEATENVLRWVGDRIALSGRWRDLIAAGIPIAGGTDHPWAIAGESGSSILAISQAVTRVGANGERPPPWMVAQSMTVDEALRSLTIDAAFAQGTEDSVGSIEVGKAADLVILSANPTAVAPKDLANIDIVATVIDGRVEYCGESVPRDLDELCPR